MPTRATPFHLSSYVSFVSVAIIILGLAIRPPHAENLNDVDANSRSNHERARITYLMLQLCF